jgi:hypothetical protein
LRTYLETNTAPHPGAEKQLIHTDAGSLKGRQFTYSALDLILQEVARTWKVEAMPTFILVKDGEEVSRVIGAKKDELERKIQMFITRSSSS